MFFAAASFCDAIHPTAGTTGLACVIAVAFASAVVPAAPPQAPAAGLTPEELQVVVAALDATALREARAFAGGKGRDSTLAVVLDSTLALCSETGQTSWCIHESSRATMERLLGGATVQLAHALSSRIPRFGERIVLVPPDVLSGVFQGPGGWEEFHRRFGETAVIDFSAPAIDGDRAAVYVGFGCGGLCGKTWLVTLERRGERFRVRKSHLLTMS
jgi:hypothetical protein